MLLDIQMGAVSVMDVARALAHDMKNHLLPIPGGTGWAKAARQQDFSSRRDWGPS